MKMLQEEELSPEIKNNNYKGRLFCRLTGGVIYPDGSMHPCEILKMPIKSKRLHYDETIMEF
jgi:hypothetical protein